MVFTVAKKCPIKYNDPHITTRLSLELKAVSKADNKSGEVWQKLNSGQMFSASFANSLGSAEL